MSQVKFIFVGGFLGAGKTTLLAQAARRLMQQGRKVGLLTNDQAANLVDTGLLKGDGFDVQEVCGGCFCCKFSDLVAASGKLIHELQPNVILGEPVGSCTDISATVLQPIKGLYGDWFSLAPFSVLVDPRRLGEVLGDKADASFSPNVLYVFRKQMEEADLIVLNKADTLSPAELDGLRKRTEARYPGIPIHAMSALTGQGVDEWLEFAMEGKLAGQRIAQVDYDAYADGEAALGWLNASVELSANHAPDWRSYCAAMIAGMAEEFRARSAEIAHLKLLLATPGGSLVANITSNQGQPLVRGVISGDGRTAVLLINARIHADPATLRAVVEECVGRSPAAGIAMRITEMQNFSPSRPNPTHRYGTVV